MIYEIHQDDTCIRVYDWQLTRDEIDDLRARGIEIIEHDLRHVSQVECSIKPIASNVSKSPKKKRVSKKRNTIQAKSVKVIIPKSKQDVQPEIEPTTVTVAHPVQVQRKKFNVR